MCNSSMDDDIKRAADEEEDEDYVDDCSNEHVEFDMSRLTEATRHFQPVCPYCGHVPFDWEDPDDGEYKCESCEKNMDVRSEELKEYICTRLEPDDE